jgi:HPt (histidine-containing phosphotransfer) domain-containing protein
MKNTTLSSIKVSNLDYLTVLSKGNKEFITEMLDIFLTETPVEIETLENAIAETDFEQIQSIVHHMRSTMPFVGLDKHIGAELIQTEQLAKARSGIQTIKINFAKIKEVCNKAVEELNA